MRGIVCELHTNTNTNPNFEVNQQWVRPERPLESLSGVK